MNLWGTVKQGEIGIGGMILTKAYPWFYGNKTAKKHKYHIYKSLNLDVNLRCQFENNKPMEAILFESPPVDDVNLAPFHGIYNYFEQFTRHVSDWRCDIDCSSQYTISESLQIQWTWGGKQTFYRSTQRNDRKKVCLPPQIHWIYLRTRIWDWLSEMVYSQLHQWDQSTFFKIQWC